MKKATTEKTPAKKAAAKPKAAPAARCTRKAAAKPAETPKTTTKNVTFTIAAAPGLPVFLAGSFNNWDPEGVPMTEKDGVYTATLALEPGEYEYKFIVNGFWTMDPDPSREWRANGLGTLNSVITVR